MGKATAIMTLGILITAASAIAQQATPAPAPDPWKTAYELQLRQDFPWLQHFQAANAALPAPTPGLPRVGLMGDSITQGWENHGLTATPTAPGRDWVNRGISGQTSPQMVLRFRQDVLDLKANVVVILAGTNDVAGNTGPMTAEQTEDNLMSMADLASANGVRVVLCSILPAADFPWKPGLNPAPKIIAINKWMKDYAAAKGYTYVDYWSAMADDKGGLPKKISQDGVHPNGDGYAIMQPLVEAGIRQALAK